VTSLRTVLAIARREFRVRVRTRSFAIGTIVLMLGVGIVAFVPVIVSYFDRADSQKVAVYVEAPQAPSNLVSTLNVLLNARADIGQPQSTAPSRFQVSAADDLDVARTDVTKGTLSAVLAVERTAGGDLSFTLYTNDNATGRTAQLVQQAVASISVSDRLARLGVDSANQAGLFAPPSYTIKWPDPARTDRANNTASLVADSLLGFGMTVLIFMMIILYGTWVAMSVVEEKSSRVMEVVLNAVTPFQLLTGKVLGVGAVAFSQYLALLVAGIAALLLQGPVASLTLGTSTGGGLPQGLTIPILAFLGVYGVLGFLLYAVLYAAAGSLVSRQEDVNQAVMPMTLISTTGYLVAVYAATGVLDAKSGWLVILSQVPFVSPFMMLSRIMTGDVSALEILLSIVILVVTIAGSLWLAARIYAAGVLLYGQRPGLRATLRLLREGM
jgi:ABC-2 type transport system permease protein